MKATTTQRVNPRMIADYEERRNSLLMDGYRVRHETILDNGVICRLHHMTNGNDIIISCINRTLTQKTNHIITYHHTYDSQT